VPQSAEAVVVLAQQLRAELADAQRARAELQASLAARNAELDALRSRLEAASTRLQHLASERALLWTRMGDKDAELRGKAKLLEVSRVVSFFFSPCLFQ
jgi:chromosome segregation ATPase